MTTPAPTLMLTTDRTTYNVGDTMVVTATYSDGTVTTVTLTVNATASDDAGNTATAQTTVSVNETTPQHMNVKLSDDFGDSFTPVSDNPGEAVFQATIGTPPAA